MSMNIKQRHFIKSSEIKQLKEDLKKQYNDDFVNQIFPKKYKVEMILTEEEDVLYAVDGDLTVWKSKEGYLPVLTLLLDKRIGLKTVIVDMGAVRFVTNGADIMRPGITRIDDEIKKGEIVRIADENNNRTLAVGKTMFDAEEMRQMKSGKVVKNLHTINDSVWEFAKNFH
ncbi:MAG: DUF1947 domain-containing protein [Candidatus Lokiarchaeota archaeon]|nr:DUF1947 domain-containing protein [Candidatus Lokiarchaeota archaeon]MBD3337504.1 DUF1947 domain-containing protein [Candidatus Lokiarchaeota archaeon]